MVEIYFLENFNRISFFVFQNRNDFVDLTGKDIISTPEVYFGDAIFYDRPLDFSFFLTIEVLEQNSYLVS